MERPLDKQTVDNICIANGLRNAKELAGASIRQLVSIVRDIEKLTGMDLEWIPLDSGSASEKVATMLADPNNMPDIFQGPLGMSDISANPTLFAELNAPVVVEVLHTRYPQGAEKQLIQSVTGRQVPPGGLPADVGVVVINDGVIEYKADIRDI